MATKCHKTKKTRFPTEDAAHKRMLTIQRNPKKDCPQRVYPCEFCGGFHLTKSLGYMKVGKPIKLQSAFEKFIHNPNEDI